MALKIHNTLSGLLEEFHPGGEPRGSIQEYPPAAIYSCGPTVYGYAHIGNFRTFIFNDLLKRYLRFSGYTVNHAMNITDVDDKTIAGASSEGVTLSEYTERYTAIFLDDLKTLNIEPADHTPRATASINAMIDIIDRLKAKGLTYEKEGSVYFSISKFGSYGKLSRLDTREIKSGLRYDTDEYEKDDVRDFVLWKAAKENEPFWETSCGCGRPGWHIECSAMIREIFGSTIDIHTGGVDLIFPHHENEIAQSEAAFDEKFVRYWIHCEHLLVNGSKMSKSAGNFYTLRDLLEKGFSPRAIRYLLISAHYRKQLNFTFEGIAQASAALARIDNFIARVSGVKGGGSLSHDMSALIETSGKQFAENLDDDLNISGGNGALFEFISAVNQMFDREALSEADSAAALDFLKKLDTVFGFIFFPAEKPDTDSERIEALIAERAQAKIDKKFKRADEIREQLLSENIVLEDTKEGTRWKIKS
jgi:cysteinyl-tRNA synthetase